MPRQTREKPVKFLKCEVSIFESGLTHMKLWDYESEGPKGKLEPWRTEPNDFLIKGGEHLQYLKNLLETYENCGETEVKEVLVAKFVMEMDSTFVIDTDYVVFEEMGPKQKRRQTRPGVEVWKSFVREYLNEKVDDYFVRT